MSRTTLAISTAALLILSGVSAEELKPDEVPIKYVDRAPREGTPQAAMLNLVLYREEGKTEEAASLLSKGCPDWLREVMLSSQGPINKDTLTYQLREYTPERALVSVDYNTPDGTFNGWTRSVIFEGGRWVVR